MCTETSCQRMAKNSEHFYHPLTVHMVNMIENCTLDVVNGISRENYHHVIRNLVRQICWVVNCDLPNMGNSNSPGRTFEGVNSGFSFMLEMVGDDNLFSSVVSSSDVVVKFKSFNCENLL